MQRARVSQEAVRAGVYVLDEAKHALYFVYDTAKELDGDLLVFLENVATGECVRRAFAAITDLALVKPKDSDDD